VRAVGENLNDWDIQEFLHLLAAETRLLINAVENH
jgi:hypothetical protein